jgi:hypothetical protein
MKMFRNFWRYLAKFFLEWKMLQTNFVEKIKTHILYSVTVFRNLHSLWDNVEKYCEDRGATDNVATWCICVTWWINKATCTYALADTHSPVYLHVCRKNKHAHTYQYVLLPVFPRQQLFLERASILRYFAPVYCCNQNLIWNPWSYLSLLPM